MKSVSSLFIVSLVLFIQSSANAQYTGTITYPTPLDSFTSNRTVGVTGTVTFPSTSPVTSVDVTITDSAGTAYYGSSGIFPGAMGGGGNFNAPVYIPSTAASGKATVEDILMRNQTQLKTISTTTTIK